MKGIYKIESPSGKVYIGQSIDIEKRRLQYSIIKNVERQPLIERSILKHGFNNHTFSVVHELPADVTKDVLTEYERIYMDQHRECGVGMLNIVAARGSIHGFKRPKEQLERFAAKMKGRISPRKGATHTPEAKEKIKAARRLQVMPKGYKRDRPVWNKGQKIGHKCSKPGGFKHSEETKEKLRQMVLGKKLSPETIAKRTATMQANLAVKPRKDWSEESKQRQSQRYAGKKLSIEHRLKIKEGLNKKKDHGISQ
jgi:group I intron endonuclease